MKFLQNKGKAFNRFMLFNMAWIALMGIIVIQNSGGINTSSNLKSKNDISLSAPQGLAAEAMALNCTNNVIISISELGYSTITPGYFISPLYPNFASLQITITGRPNPIITCDDVNQFLGVVIYDPVADQTCSTIFKVEDKLAPRFECITKEVPCGIDIYNVGPPYAELVTVTDNCTNPPAVTILSHTERVYNCPSPYTFEIVRTYKATDASGNFSTCQDTVRFLRPVIDEIIFPNDTTMSCEAFSSDTSVTGEPTWMGYPLRGVCFTWFGHQDKLIPMGCEGRFKIRRIWTVMDECNNTMRRDTQNIMSIDTTGPIVVCPDDQVVPTNSGSCVATYLFQEVEATDACSSTITFQYKVDGILVFTPSIDLEVGNHVIEATANDGCNNTSSCTYNVLVQDQQVPNVTCHNINVGLGNNLTGIVCADSLDFDYFDNCSGTLTILIKKSTDLLFTNCVTYTCDEVGSDNLLQVQVCDENNNCTVCEFVVTVQDLEFPVIECGEDDIELSCIDLPTIDPNDYLPVVTDNCGDVEITSEIFYDLDCNNEGIIIISYTATDASGNAASCSQRLNVTNPNALDEGDIIWPADIDMAGCNPNPNDTSITGYPILLGEFCGDIDIFSALVDTTTNGENCAVIIKQYTVIDSCIFNLSGGLDGKFTHNQMITISGGTAPVLTVPSDITIEPTDSANCTATVDLALATATGCGQPITITNSFNGGGANADGVYPLGVTIVTFTATNVCGVQSTGVTTVTVEYESDELLICPDGFEISCMMDFNPADLPGPTITNVCGSYDIDTLITGNLDACNTSLLTVTYSIVTNDGRTDECSFNINIEGATPLTESQIIWPDANILIECISTTDPSDVNSFPVINSPDQCPVATITFEDEMSTPIDPMACWAFTRLWTVTDSCNFDPNTGEGIFTFSQHVDVVDTLDPSITIYSNNDTLFFDIPSNQCNVYVDFSDVMPLDCSPILEVGNNFPGSADALSLDASGLYPLGVTKVRFYLADICVNKGDVIVYVSVKNTNPPTWNCPSSLDFVLDASGLDTVHASDFSYVPFNAMDNCGDTSLIFTFDSLDLGDSLLYLACTGTVSDLSMPDVQVWVYNNNDLSASCKIDLNVIVPPGQNTDCSHLMGIFGQLVDENNHPVEAARVSAKGDGEWSSQTDEFGKYQINDLPPGGDLMVKATKNDRPLDGVNVADIIAIRDHILGKKNLASPYKILAGDVNADNSMSVKDLIEIRKLLLGKTDKFSSEMSWRFADKSFKFANASNPFNQEQVWGHLVQNIVGMMPKVHFIGVKLGDVNTSALDNDRLSTPEIRENQPLMLYSSVISENEDEVRVKLSGEQLKNIRGFQFDLQYNTDALKFVKFESGDLRGFDEENYNAEMEAKGIISFSWDDESGREGNEIGVITFKKLRKGEAVESISINKDRISAIGSDLLGNEKGIELIATGKWEGSNVMAGKLLQNVPNPFFNKTNISVVLSQSTQGRITVFDVTGRAIYTKTSIFEKGLNTIEIKANELNGSGVYIYKFESDLFTDTKKMILTL